MKLVNIIPIKQPIQAVSIAIELSFPVSDTFVFPTFGGRTLLLLFKYKVLLYSFKLLFVPEKYD